MADLRISAMPDNDPALGTDKVPVSRTDGGAPGRVTVASIRSGAIRTVTGNYTLTSTDDGIFVNSTSDRTMTLPSATLTPYASYRIKNLSTGVVTVTSTTLIDGAATQTLPEQWTAMDFRPSGANWYIF